MSLHSLPEELLLNIISHIPGHADIASLASQCRRLHKLCDLPIRRKYRRVKLHSPKQLAVGFDMLCSILRNPRLGAYVRHIELKRSPFLGEDTVGAYDPPRDPRPLEPGLEAELRQAIHRAGFESVEAAKILNILSQDARALKDEDGDDDQPIAFFFAQALASILTSVSPNLERLTLCPAGQEYSKRLVAMERAAGRELDGQDYFFKHFLERSAGNKNLPFLQNLRTVRFILISESNSGDSVDRYYQEYDLHGSLNLVRRLPAIESVRLDAITDPEESSIHPPPRSANYTKIIIQNSKIDYQYLVDAIESAKQLKEFTFSVGGRASFNELSHRLFDSDVVFKSLIGHWNTLEHLDLNVESDVLLPVNFNPDFELLYLGGIDPGDDEEEYQCEWADELNELRKAEQKSTSEGDSSPPCSLRSFVRLKHLSLGIHLLYHFARGIGDDQLADGEFSVVDQLPPSLESLRIYGYTKKMKPPLKELPRHMFQSEIKKLKKEKNQKLPLLRVIEGIDQTIANAKSMKRFKNQRDELWQRESDCDWTDYEY